MEHIDSFKVVYAEKQHEQGYYNGKSDGKFLCVLLFHIYDGCIVSSLILSNYLTRLLPCIFIMNASGNSFFIFFKSGVAALMELYSP